MDFKQLFQGLSKQQTPANQSKFKLTPKEKLIQVHREGVKGQQELFAKKTNERVFFNQTVSIEKKIIYTMKSIANLQPIFIRQLALGENRGCYLRGKLLETPIKYNAISLLIEDDEQTITRLAFYNFPIPKGNTEDQIFYSGCMINIKEPFFKIASDGYEIIRVESPEDVSFEENTKNAESRTALELKEEGNTLFKNSKFNDALQVYRQATTKQPIDTKLWAILYTNIAACSIHEERYRSATDAAQKAIQYNPEYLKARYRLVESLIWDGKLERAKVILAEIESKLDVGDRENLIQHMKKAEANSKGIYDWWELFQAYDTKKYKIGTFVHPALSIQLSSECFGNGVISTKDLPKGTLLVVDRAFSFVSEQAINATTQNIDCSISITQGMINTQSRCILENDVLRLCSVDQYKRAELFRLHNTWNTNLNIQQREKQASDQELDAKEISSIVQNNCFGLMDFNKYFKGSKKYGGFQSDECGVWIFCSFFNHQCLPNCTYLHFGKYMIVRTISDIKAGDELFVTYINPCLSIEERQNSLKSSWNFKCKCPQCKIKPSKKKAATIKRIFEMYEILEIQPEAGADLNRVRKEKQVIIDELYKTVEDSTQGPMHLRLMNSIQQYGNRNQYTTMMLTIASNINDVLLDIGTLIYILDGLNSFIIGKEDERIISVMRDAAFQAFSILFSNDQEQYLKFEEWFAGKYKGLAKPFLDRQWVGLK